MATFYRALQGRNGAVGITTLVLSFAGQRKALGVLLLCWTLAGIADTHILFEVPGGDNWVTHVVNIGTLTIESTALLLS